ncbi:quinolinate synthase NadA [bacterium 210820-DFI.6.37]|nr:quinolinate synthase NadA [bacterium 210820-DFI.6.37]
MEKEMLDTINKLKKEKNAVILAHYYVDGEVQAIADYVGDSFYLSRIAAETDADVILFCGVSFMGESAKILSPEKRVVMADELADCPMAHMVELEKIQEVRQQYPDVAVVCYVNSTAEIKTAADVCVTSSNAVKVVKALPAKQIFFVPDNNLGRYVADQLPEKEFIFHDGFCHVHVSIQREAVIKAKEAHPEALVLAHPECTQDVLELADYIGSTSGIIDYATKSQNREFIICTEMGIFYELGQKNPDKRFYAVGHRQFCHNMKRITLDKVVNALETLEPQVLLDEKTMEAARAPLARMLELAGK